MSGQNYWAVGATSPDDNFEEAYYRRGYWEMGWSDEDKPHFAKKRDSMKTGDRIAIKSRDGYGADTITIKALGIIKEVADGRVYVNWVVTGMDRQVPCKNYFGTIHGPVGDEEWINQAFRL